MLKFREKITFQKKLYKQFPVPISDQSKLFYADHCETSFGLD